MRLEHGRSAKPLVFCGKIAEPRRYPIDALIVRLRGESGSRGLDWVGERGFHRVATFRLPDAPQSVPLSRVPMVCRSIRVSASALSVWRRFWGCLRTRTGSQSAEVRIVALRRSGDVEAEDVGLTVGQLEAPVAQLDRAFAFGERAKIYASVA